MAKPEWISHRGLHTRHTENTVGAFREARASGFRHMETDLRTTVDGHIVLTHDAKLQRLSGANGWNKPIEQSTRAELSAITLPCGNRLMFFNELLQEFSDCRWILDIKPESAPTTIQLLLAYWQKPEYSSFFTQQVRFLFWHQDHQAQLLAAQPLAHCMAALHACRRAAIATLLRVPGLGNIQPGITYAVPPSLLGQRLLNLHFAKAYQTRGARVLGYLPETDEHVHWALDSGVDEMLVNGTPLGQSPTVKR